LNDTDIRGNAVVEYRKMRTKFRTPQAIRKVPSFGAV